MRNTFGDRLFRPRELIGPDLIPIQGLDDKKFANETKSKAISKPNDLAQEEYLVIFKEIVRRMVRGEASHQTISLQQKKLIDAVIFFENEINKGKDSQGELVHFKFVALFPKIDNEELIEQIAEIINFYCFTLKSINLESNSISLPALKIFISNLKFHMAPVLEEMHLWQYPNLSEECITILFERLKSNTSLRVITYRKVNVTPEEAKAWELVNNQLDYNLQLVAREVLRVLISLLPKHVIQFIINDYLLGDLNISLRREEPLHIPSDFKETNFPMQLEGEKGIWTVSLPAIFSNELKVTILNKADRLDLRRVGLTNLQAGLFLLSSLLLPAYPKLEKLDIDDKSIDVAALKGLLGYLKLNTSLIEISLGEKSLTAEEEALYGEISAELDYNYHVKVASIAYPVLCYLAKELIYKSLDGQAPDEFEFETFWFYFKFSNLIDHVVSIVISYLLGEAENPQRIAKSLQLPSYSSLWSAKPSPALTSAPNNNFTSPRLE